MKYPYEYLLHIWGGAIQELQLESLKYQWFRTEEDRNKEINRLKVLFSNCKSKRYALSKREGELTRHNFIIKSLIFYKEEYYWVYNNLGFGFFTKEELYNNTQEYLLKWKWGICPPDDNKGNKIDLNSNECLLLNTSLIIEEPQEIKKSNLGNATTKQLLEELESRMENTTLVATFNVILESLSEEQLNYKTINYK